MKQGSTPGRELQSPVSTTATAELVWNLSPGTASVWSSKSADMAAQEGPSGLEGAAPDSLAKSRWSLLAEPSDGSGAVVQLSESMGLSADVRGAQSLAMAQPTASSPGGDD